MAPRMRHRITSSKREEIERQQREMSKAIARPFDVIGNLPVSYTGPPSHYEEVFKNPLTVKDSGVLYRSLMKSRYNYMNVGPMFDLYWIKQSSYARKQQQQEEKSRPKGSKEDKPISRVPMLGPESSARDIMVKLCDANLTIGPHDFMIRIFIAKDERSEKQVKKEASVPGPEMETKLSVANVRAPSTSSPALQDVSLLNHIETTPGTNENDAIKDITEVSATLGAAEELVEDKTRNSNVSLDQRKNSNGVNKNEKHNSIIQDPTQNDEKKQQNDEAEGMVDNDNKRLKGDASLSGELVDEKSSHHSSERVADNSPKNTTTNKISDSSSKPKPKIDTHNMQSLENSIMISNLNSIARADQSLNSLMKVVALGNASPQQIITFQGYIQRAREMGPQPHHAHLFANSKSSSYKDNIAKIRKTVREKKPQKPKVLKDQKLTAFQEKYLNNATILFEFAENANVRYMLPKDAICEVSDSNSSEFKDIIFSFVWIHNQKEITLYKKKLSEYNLWLREKERKEHEKANETKVVERGDLSEKGNEEFGPGANEDLNEGSHNLLDAKQTPEGGEEKAKTADQHNKTDESEHHTCSTSAQGSEKIESTMTDKSQTGTKSEASLNAAPITSNVTSKRRTRSRRGFNSNKGSKAKVLEPPIEPEIRYSCVSLTIRNIPLKFVPIITNSVRPLAEVQGHMSKILEKGHKTSSYYLWYQLDGKVDEALAEQIRVELNSEEKKMQGVTNHQATSRSNNKRKRDDISEESAFRKSIPDPNAAPSPKIKAQTLTSSTLNT